MDKKEKCTCGCEHEEHVCDCEHDKDCDCFVVPVADRDWAAEVEAFYQYVDKLSRCCDVLCVTFQNHKENIFSDFFVFQNSIDVSFIHLALLYIFRLP